MSRIGRLQRIATFVLVGALVAACGGGGGGGTGGGGGGGGIIPTPTPTPGVTSQCTFNSVNPQSIAGVVPETMARRAVRRGAAGPRYVTGVVEVLYARARGVREAIAQSGERLAAPLDAEVEFGSTGTAMSVVRVAPGGEEAAMATLRSVAGVRAVAQAQYRHLEAAAVYFPNDKYWDHNGTGAPPFYQTDAQGGQWDMHLICVSRAWGYSQIAGNTFGVVPGVLAGSVKIASVDTGEDTTHPDLAGKVVYQATYNGGSGLKISSTVNDKNGHGTNVAGIAASATNNGFGFVGAGFNAKLMAYKVFPDPPMPCSGSSCDTSASTTDIAAAINDAVAHGANLISMSLGATPTGASCQSGVGGDDPAEIAAINAANAAGVVVVAAAGNESATKLDCPGGDAGVIAVGATSLTDTGVGTAVTGEHVASYSNYDVTNPTGWGVSAPGGDPSGGSDADFYHWIEHIWTSTPADPSFTCPTDTFGEVGNCRILIAGTSQATPHIAGVVALMLGAHPGLAPATVKADLCNTAVNIADGKQGCGRVDAYRAVARALGDASVP